LDKNAPLIRVSVFALFRFYHYFTLEMIVWQQFYCPECEELIYDEKKVLLLDKISTSLAQSSVKKMQEGGL
jgi:hypothetical protein